MNQSFIFPFGADKLTVSLPEANIAWVTGPRDTPAVADLRGTVLQALNAPVDAPRLEELVRRYGQRTVILVDDSTRSTPQKVVLPILLDELNRVGVPDNQISVLIGLGTHRAMRPEEIQIRFGEAVMNRVRIKNLPQTPADFIDLGVTERGIPVQISREMLESDISIAVGTIIPHMYAGWSGGAKMIQPAVSSAVTTARTHLMAGPLVYQILGNVDNPVRREMEQVAAKAGLKFILNFVLNCDGQVVAAVAGDPVGAHRQGVEIARPIYCVDVAPLADIVVASSHPADRDLWQGFKPVNNCGMLVRDGGTLICSFRPQKGLLPITLSW